MGQFLRQNPGIGGIDEITDAEALFLQNLAGLTYTAGDILYHDGTNLINLGIGTAGQMLATNAGATAPEWTAVSGTGTVTSVSVVSANGLAGTVATATSTPAITLSTSITGILKGNGTAISAGTDGTDYLSSTTGLTLDQTTAQTIGATGTRLTKLWAVDITVTNAITGDITGNAGTATTATTATNIAGGAEASLPYQSSANTTAMLANGTDGQYLMSNGTTVAPSWETLAAGGDMVLASIQSVTGLKTFDKDKIATKGTSTGVTLISTANTSGTDYTQTLPARDGTIANLDNVTYIGTTSVALNRGSAALTLAGITLTTPDIGTPSAGTLTNCDGTASSLTAGSVTNATFTTALTVNTGTLTLIADAGNDSVLTIGGGAVSVSGANTGDNTVCTSGTATTAATLATTRAIYGNNFDGSAALTQVIASTYGGTGNGFTKFTGPTTAERVFTLPDASSTLLYSGGALGTPSGGTLTNATGLPLTGLVDDTTTALGVGTLELGHASDTTLARSAAGVLMVENVVIPSISSTNTLTNKRITKRVVTTTDDATAAINTDTTDVYDLSAIANATVFTLTGTPTDGQTLIVRFKDAGTTKGLTWTGFTAIGVTLPTDTTASKQHYVGCMYNGTTGTPRWEAIAVTEEA